MFFCLLLPGGGIHDSSMYVPAFIAQVLGTCISMRILAYFGVFLNKPFRFAHYEIDLVLSNIKLLYLQQTIIDRTLQNHHGHEGL